jgi:hypothetical protein
MLAGFKRIAIAIVLTTIAGAIIGGLVGVLTENILLWVGIMAAVGAGFGVAMGYGFLPES